MAENRKTKQRTSEIREEERKIFFLQKKASRCDSVRKMKLQEITPGEAAFIIPDGTPVATKEECPRCLCDALSCGFSHCPSSPTPKLTGGLVSKRLIVPAPYARLKARS